MKKTNDYWKDKLSPEAFRILREKGTEYPHTGEYNLHFETGVYSCMACKEPLFESQSKFRSDCGDGQVLTMPLKGKFVTKKIVPLV